MRRAKIFIVDTFSIRRRRLMNRFREYGYTVSFFESIADASKALDPHVLPHIILVGQAPDDAPGQWRDWKYRWLIFRYAKDESKARSTPTDRLLLIATGG
jgi:hypothetical protein